MRLSRRTFLELAGGAAAASAAGCKALERGYPEKYWVDQPPVPGAAAPGNAEERRVRSVCLQCDGGCGIVVRVVGGRAVKIEGNPDYPTNQGGLCPKGLNGLQTLYDPDRIAGPLRRDGARGTGRWRPITWEEAIGRVARELGALRARGAAHTVAFLGGRYRGHMRALVQRFLGAYGSPNDIDHESLCTGSDRAAYELCQGVRDRLAYDWERTRYVMAFGAGLVESFRPTAMMLRVFGHLRAGRPGARAKLVVVDPRYGVSSARADEWVPVRPGTDAALALGLAHVLVRDRLFDMGFVRERTHGFERWRDAAGREHLGFRELIMRDYAPARVAARTGVPAATIERLARELAAERPAIAVAGRGTAAHTAGVYNVLAVHALNALLGSIDAPGGVMVQRPPPLGRWSEVEPDEAARRGLAAPRFDLDGAGAPLAGGQMNGLAERIERGAPYPLGALLLYYTNPLFSAPAPARLRAALERVPFIASFSPFMDESTALADVVLPDHTYLERWQLEVATPSVGFPLLGLRQPVVKPLLDTRSTGEVLIAVGRALGGSVARAFLAGELDMIKQLVKGVHASGRGSVRADKFEDFWDKLLAAGGWWDAPYRFGEWPEVLRTPSGRYEFFASRLQARLDAAPGAKGQEAHAAALARLGVAARGDEAFLPHQEPVAAAPGYPFVLISYKTMTHAEGRGANQPHLQELFGVQFDHCWQPWVEIHPEDARAHGIHDGDHVWLSSPQGRVKLRATLVDAGTRGVLAVPFEYGHSGYGRWASGRGANVNQLGGLDRDPLSGGVGFYDLRVQVSRA